MKVVAIDAGGTNFRAAIVMFTGDGKMEISELISSRMPGIDGEVSKDKFFEIMAGQIKPLAEKCEGIGFCFSYPSEILPNKDGILLTFCKEVQAPGVVGQQVGKNLLETMGMSGKPIVVLNDTVATLLAGKSKAFGKDYDTYIGFILGTGTNTCYSESNSNILKKPELDRSRSQIINIESGSFSKVTRSDIDDAFDKTTTNPGEYAIEKMTSGGYIGGLSLTALKQAAEENVFSEKTALAIKSLKELSTGDAGRYLTNDGSPRGILAEKIHDGHDERSVFEILEAIIERAGKVAAAEVAAVVLKTNKGNAKERPILVTIEGTTFYRLKGLRPSFEKYMSLYLSGDLKRYYEFTEVPQSSLVGAALAALIE
jgi:hexokinase